MAVLAYIVAILAVVSGLAWAVEGLAVTPAAQAVRTLAERVEPPKPAPVDLNLGGGGRLSPIYPATPGKELLAAYARSQTDKAPAFRPTERRIAIQKRLERQFAARAGSNETLGYAEETTPQPVFKREIAY
ncbi:MAG TPA: hypothetical protein VFB45_21875 [Pseudolabrys sp.]|nr:hypothetical protein [Pseudolabrys sp.]